MLGRDYSDQDCLVARALEVVGERWTLLVVRDAFYGLRRFGEFREHLDIPRAVLSDRLKGLVEHGVMKRRPDPDRPRREIYELTEAGCALWPIVYGLSAWAAAHVDGADALREFTHLGCGQPLDPAGGCKCSPSPAAGELVMSPRPGARSARKDRVSLALAEPHRLLTPLALGERAA
jgi:DNA-binding HxlR family transcriptional regulator